MLKLVKNILRMFFIIPIFAFYLAIIAVVLAINNTMNPIRSLQIQIIECCKSILYHTTASMVSRWFPKPFFVKYDKRIIDSDRNIIISNHCSDYDWLFLFVLLNKLGKFQDSYVLLKRSLRQVPLMGYICSKLEFIFLSRKKDKDIDVIAKGLSKISGNPKYNVLIYPEGTYPYKESIISSREYAKKAKMVVDGQEFIPENILMPRKTGFELIKKQLYPSFQSLIDTTIIMNPYMLTAGDDVPPFELFFNEKAPINQILILKLVDKAKIDDSYIFKTFKKKDDLIKKYLETTNKNITTETQFKRFIEEADPLTENDVIACIETRSSYIYLIYVIPFILLTVIGYRVSKN
jgi:lysocardiolipin and lysophospholipid acyltransferase